jgi:hypothetical protein
MAEFGARFAPEQPNCNPKWPRLRRRLCKVPVSTNTPWCWSTEGDDQRTGVRRRGTDSCSGEHRGGLSSEKVRRPSVVVGRRNPGGADGPGRRTFRARTATRATATSPPRPGQLHQLISRPQVDAGQSVAFWRVSVGRCGEVTRHSEAVPGVRRSRCRKTESQIRDSPGTSRTDSVSLFPLGLPLSPVQLRPDARRPHLRAGHRGRG